MQLWLYGMPTCLLPGAAPQAKRLLAGNTTLTRPCDKHSQLPSTCRRQQGRDVSAAAGKSAKRLKYAAGGGKGGAGDPRYVVVERDGSDLWRLDALVDLLRDGAVGVLPTDTLPALVCDCANTAAVARLYAAKGLAPRKPLSILVRNFSDIGTYTLGFPVSNVAGRSDLFKVARQVLPGPYTFILTASKQLPRQCVDNVSGKSKPRKSVGVRMPDHPVCQAVLQQLDRPLLCSSVYVRESYGIEVPEAAVIMDAYAGRGLDFVVDAGREALAEGSTVIDMTSGTPVLVRQGRGDASIFVPEDELAYV